MTRANGNPPTILNFSNGEDGPDKKIYGYRRVELAAAYSTAPLKHYHK